MILIDTSVWIDHLHAAEPGLISLLENDLVGCHPMVIEELALGSLRRRGTLIRELTGLHRFPTLSHHELLALVAAHRLWGRGLSAVDAHLFGSALLVEGATVWTRDKRLAAACDEADIGFAPVV